MNKFIPAYVDVAGVRKLGGGKFRTNNDWNMDTIIKRENEITAEFCVYCNENPALELQEFCETCRQFLAGEDT